MQTAVCLLFQRFFDRSNRQPGDPRPNRNFRRLDYSNVSFFHVCIYSNFLNFIKFYYLIATETSTLIYWDCHSPKTMHSHLRCESKNQNKNALTVCQRTTVSPNVLSKSTTNASQCTAPSSTHSQCSPRIR